MKDELVRAMTKDGFVNAVAVTTTGIVERARQIHKTLPTATAALGRLVRAGRLSEAQYRESCRCRRAHMAKGASPSLLDRYDRYCDDVLRGALDDRH